jgi:hypothetical protein
VIYPKEGPPHRISFFPAACIHRVPFIKSKPVLFREWQGYFQCAAPSRFRWCEGIVVGLEQVPLWGTFLGRRRRYGDSGDD